MLATAVSQYRFQYSITGTGVLHRPSPPPARRRRSIAGNGGRYDSIITITIILFTKRERFMVKKIALTLCTALVAGSMAMAQNRTVTGKITDANGSPIIGATVKVEGSKNVGAVTAGDGQFSISVPANSKLNITYIGYNHRLYR